MSGLGMMMQMFSQMKMAAGQAPNNQQSDRGQGQSDRGQGQTSRGQGSSDMGSGQLDKSQVQSNVDQIEVNPSEKSEANVEEENKRQQESQKDHSLQTSVLDPSVVTENNNVEPMAKLLRSELERMENRMMAKVEKLIQQSEDRICARMTELLLTKTQGDSLGLD